MLRELKEVAKQKVIAQGKRRFQSEVDIFTKMYAFTRAKTARAFHYYPYFPSIEQADATEVVIDGEKKIMLGSNNYLGLTNHPKVIEAGVRALRTYGSGLTGSRLLNGNLRMHEELEEKLAAFVGKEKALVFSTGFGVNLGVIGSALDPEDQIFSDEFNHASIVDGSRFSRAEIYRYTHNDPRDLERKLQGSDPQRGRFIVTDGIFSMEGDIAPLDALIPVAKKYKARIMVDDAHALGVLGPRGEGTAAHFGLTAAVDLIMGTFSKSLGSVGGFIAAEEPVIDYLKHHTRTMIFTAALPPVNVATVLQALELIQTEPERIRQVHDNAEYYRSGLQQLGFNTGNSTTPVVPVIIGHDLKTFLLWKDLLKAGVYTNPIVPNAVPKGRSLLRTAVMASHSRDQLDYCLDQFRIYGKKHRLIR